ncbi:MAG: 2Fe-2S iron-sulfur cluster binding domain-containing protein [Microcoleus sp. SIO2G3]|nr:2Fe-2S iron-sulfur cluster binding domain-containing protein [Microcoleus sp. SIO2G3]
MWFRLRRRRFGQVMIASTAAAALGNLANKIAQNSPRRLPADPALESSTVDVMLRVNGKDQSLKIEPRVTLLDALREYVGFTGTKKGCDRGQCGACTVMVNGRRVNSCLTLAMMHVGDEITTIEGLARGEDLHPMQAAFIKHDGFQCGYCTPGQICSAIAMLNEVAVGTASAVTADLTATDSVDLSDGEIRERMSGNICRCGAYPNIVSAIREVHGKQA